MMNKKSPRKLIKKMKSNAAKAPVKTFKMSAVKRAKKGTNWPS